MGYRKDTYTGSLILRGLRLYWSYYRTFCFPSLILSVWITILALPHGAAEAVFAFWIKLFTLGLILTFSWNLRTREFYYYRNLGIGTRSLLVVTFCLDLALYLAIWFTAFALYG